MAPRPRRRYALLLLLVITASVSLLNGWITIPPSSWVYRSHQVVSARVGVRVGVDNNAGGVSKPLTYRAHESNGNATTTTTTLVIPSLRTDDLAWLDEIPAWYSRAVYTVDDRHAVLRPPKNKGNEAMVYLSYILDFYDDLPDVSVFVHSHRHAWHNNDMLDNDMALQLRRLDVAAVQRRGGYTTLRCQWYPGCPDHLHPFAGKKEDPTKMEEALIAGVWAELYPGKPLPAVLAQPCCSQFAVSRDAIRRVGRDEYARLRDWLLKTKIRNSMSGRIFEYTWQVLFSGESTYCPSESACYCELYGLCFESEDEFKRVYQMRMRMRQDEWMYFAWQSAVADSKPLSEIKTDEQAKALKRKMELDWLEFAELRDTALGRRGGGFAG